MPTRYSATLLGLAIGDALGYPHEFRSRDQVRKEIGPEGITDFIRVKDPRFSRPFMGGPDHPPGTYTDDTQMTLAVAQGLLTEKDDHLDAVMHAIGDAFVEWSTSDDNNRAPGGTCMTGCENLARGIPWREAGVANSKGCGSAMRVAPIGLFFHDLDDVERYARASSLLTHGHDAALEGAAAAALLVRMALGGASPDQMHEEVDRRCAHRSADFAACWQKLPDLIDHEPEDVLIEGVLGESWVAEEAAASALYCVWRHPDDYEAGVLTAVNTDGDSDSIATIAGSILGALLGLDAIPKTWRDRVENADLLAEIGMQLFTHRRGFG